jgi:ribosomal protein S18 acetylase RimI-like enzyme
MHIAIDFFRPEHGERFGELNREWLVSHGLMEPVQTYFLDGGGQIFVALHDGQVIGTCAVMPRGRDELELAKLTVASEFRGQGIARRLVEQCVAYARDRGVRRLSLVSNSRLQAALRLYESFGFTYSPVPKDTMYDIADVCMILDLEPATEAG